MKFTTLDDAITLYLRRENITQEQLAERMGMSANTFSWKRRGIREFTLSEAAKLADMIGISLDAVLSEYRMKTA